MKYKILFLYDDFRFITDRLFYGFIVKLSKYCTLNVYGPETYKEQGVPGEIPKRNKELVPFEYNKNWDGKDLVREFNPDLIFMAMYNQKVLDWYPENICRVGVPTILLEDDHYTYDPVLSKYKGTKPLEWYKSSGLTLLLRRHFYKEKAPIPSIWFPQSANDEEFIPYYGERENSIGFAGSFEPTPWYEVRRNAIETIGKANLLAGRFGKFEPKEYPDYIKSYKGILGCSGGILHTPLAKMFECMLSNTPYLTNWFHHSHLLFGLKEYCFIYKDNCSDLVKKAKIILNEPDYVAEVTKNALEVTQREHTDSVRIKQLYDIIEAIIEGREPPKRWGF